MSLLGYIAITENEKELCGATANNSSKPTITDTGLTLTAHLLVKIGKKMIVYTVDGHNLSLSDE